MKNNLNIKNGQENESQTDLNVIDDKCQNENNFELNNEFNFDENYNIQYFFEILSIINILIKKSLIRSVISLKKMEFLVFFGIRGPINYEIF